MRSHLADFELVTAANLGAALQLLASQEPWRPMAGATDIMVLFNAGRLPYKKLVSVAKLPELRGIAVSPESICLGAAVTYAEIQRDAALQAEFPLLCQAAGWTGGVANQNRGTLGGNIANASPAADSLPALLVYDAEIEIASLHGTRRIPYAGFHFGYKKMDLKPGELLVKIHLPRPQAKVIQWAWKVGARRAQAISKVNFNALAEISGGVVKRVRVAVGSVAPIPLRCTKVEAALTGQTLTPQLRGHVRHLIASEIQPIDDIRSTARYRAAVTQNLLGEFLERLR